MIGEKENDKRDKRMRDEGEKRKLKSENEYKWRGERMIAEWG